MFFGCIPWPETRTCSCTQGNGLQDIRRTPDATIDEELEPIVRKGNPTLLLELLDDLDENLDSRARKVQLTPTVIREDDTGKVLVVRFQSVLPCLHAFEDEWNFRKKSEESRINYYG